MIMNSKTFTIEFRWIFILCKQSSLHCCVRIFKMFFLRIHFDHLFIYLFTNNFYYFYQIHRIITLFDYRIRFKTSLCLIISVLKSKIFENFLNSSKLQIWNNDDETWNSFWTKSNYDITSMISNFNLFFLRKKFWIFLHEMKRKISRKKSKIMFSKWSMLKTKLKICVTIL